MAVFQPHYPATPTHKHTHRHITYQHNLGSMAVAAAQCPVQRPRRQKPDSGFADGREQDALTIGVLSIASLMAAVSIDSCASSAAVDLSSSTTSRTKHSAADASWRVKLPRAGGAGVGMAVDAAVGAAVGAVVGAAVGAAVGAGGDRGDCSAKT